MDTDQLLERLAERYRRQGYTVTVNPSLTKLPPFAKGFKIELLAERPDGNVLVSAKPSTAEIERDTTLADLADVVGRYPGWRFDMTLLQAPEPPARSAPRDATDLTRAQIEKMLGDAQKMYDSGFKPQAAITAWSAFESAMRHRLRSMGQKAGYGTPPRSMLNALISAGEIDHGEFRDLDGISNLRNVIVHGFEPPPVGRGALEFLGALAHRLLEETELEPSAP